MKSFCITAMEQGGSAFEILYDLSNADYHRAEGISSSGLKAILRSPAHYKAFSENVYEQTESQRFGELCHLAIFENSRYANSIAVCPNIRRDSKAFKDFAVENEGKLILKAEEAMHIAGISNAIMSHPLAAELITGGKPEVSVFATCPITGLRRKVRPDYLRDDDLIIDLKTTKNAQFNSFQRDTASFKYHLSAAYYLDTVNLTSPAVQKKTFVLIAVEKEPPYGVMVYSLDPEGIARGRNLYEEALNIYKECRTSGHWPCYGTDVMNLPLPPWAFTEE